MKSNFVSHSNIVDKIEKSDSKINNYQIFAALLARKSSEIIGTQIHYCDGHRKDITLKLKHAVEDIRRLGALGMKREAIARFAADPNIKNFSVELMYKKPDIGIGSIRPWGGDDYKIIVNYYHIDNSPACDHRY